VLLPTHQTQEVFVCHKAIALLPATHDPNESDYIFFDGHARWFRPELVSYNKQCCPPKEPSNGATDPVNYNDGINPSFGM
jgi:hypothetical protein